MNGASGRHWPSAVRVVSTHVVETGADDDVVNDMIHDRVVVRPLSRWCRFLMRYCVRGTALVMSFRFFITSRRNERTLSLSLPNVVHPIRITCMRCTFFQVRSGIISRGVIVRRLMIIMPLSPRKTSTIPQGIQLTILRDLSQLSAKN